MPIADYFNGKGRVVLRKMKEKYGGEKGERIFYATAKKQGMEPIVTESVWYEAPNAPPYALRVHGELWHIMENVANISEKDFRRQDGLSAVIKDILATDSVREITGRFESQESRPAFCAEYIFSKLNYNMGDIASAVERKILTANKEEGVSVRPAIRVTKNEDCGIIHIGILKHIPGQMPDYSQLTETKKKGRFRKLKDNRTKLDPEERAEVMKRGAVWHHGPHGERTPAVWKSKDPKTGKVTYVCNTHRAYQAKPTLKGAIIAFRFIKTTA